MDLPVFSEPTGLTENKKRPYIILLIKLDPACSPQTLPRSLSFAIDNCEKDE